MTNFHTYRPVGLEYLKMVTELLQKQRLSDLKGGVWEAADMQWSWRHDQHDNHASQVFWMEDGSSVAALVFSDEGEYLSCDLFYDPQDERVAFEVAHTAFDQLGEKVKPVMFNVRDDNRWLIEFLTAKGFSPGNDVFVEAWLQVEMAPEVTGLAEGFDLRLRSELKDLPHHMIQRNGLDIAERLAECSLYDPELDLVVYSAGGEVAGYSLFWADPVTHVGLVEPMRVEEKYQRKGMARHMIAVGLNKLASKMCDRFKVSYAENNESARRLYMGVGFEPYMKTRTYCNV